jgi:hypothetical protein
MRLNLRAAARWPIYLLLIYAPFSLAFMLTPSVAYLAGVRYQNAAGQADYYDGFAYGGRVSFGGAGKAEFFASYYYTNQVANYDNLPVGPISAKEHHLGLGVRKFLANGQRCFLQGQLLGIVSDGFPSPRVGLSLGGGLSWSLMKSLRFGITTLYSFVPYSGFHRRFLTQTFDLGLDF